MPFWDAVCKGMEEQGDHTKPRLNGAVSAFTVCPENLTRCIHYLHWESPDSMHSLSTLRIWLDAFVIYGENPIRCIRYPHWESPDSMHLLSTHFQKFEQLCGVVCSVSVSPDAKHLGLLLPMHSSEKVIICYIFSKLPSFYRLKIKSLPLGGRISPLLLPINHHGWQKKKSFQFSVLGNDKGFYNFNILRPYQLQRHLINSFFIECQCYYIIVA